MRLSGTRGAALFPRRVPAGSFSDVSVRGEHPALLKVPTYAQQHAPVSKKPANAPPAYEPVLVSSPRLATAALKGGGESEGELRN